MATKSSKPAVTMPGSVTGPVDDLDALLASLTPHEAPTTPPSEPEPVAAVPPVVVPEDKEDLFIPQPTTKKPPAVISHATPPEVVPAASMSVDPFFDSLIAMDELPEYLNLVVYGRTGTGKTTFGAQGDKTLVLEIEPHGTFSVASRGLATGKRKVIRSWSDIEETYWWLKKHPGVFDCVTFDTATRMMELCTKSVLVDKETDDFTITNKDVWKVTLAQRGDAAQRMIFWMEAFRSLPMHKIWLLQETAGSGEEAGVGDFDVFPDIQKKPRSYLLGDATIVGRMEIRMQSETDGSETPRYCLVVGANTRIYTKDRTNALGQGMVNPTLAKIVKKVYSKKGA